MKPGANCYGRLKPDALDFVTAASVPVVAITAMQMLFDYAHAQAGQSVLILGAAGSVGSYAVQLAAQNGAHVTAVVGRRERGEGLAELGAADVVVGPLPPEGEPFTLIIESVGGDSLAAALARVAPEGTVVSCGNSSRQPTTFDPSTFYGKAGARLYAFVLGPELERSRGATTDLRYLANLVAVGHLDVGIDRVVDAHDVAAVRAACTDLLDRKVNGKAVLRF